MFFSAALSSAFSLGCVNGIHLCTETEGLVVTLAAGYSVIFATGQMSDCE